MSCDRNDEHMSLYNRFGNISLFQNTVNCPFLCVNIQKKATIKVIKHILVHVIGPVKRNRQLRVSILDSIKIKQFNL